MDMYLKSLRSACLQLSFSDLGIFLSPVDTRQAISVNRYAFAPLFYVCVHIALDWRRKKSKYQVITAASETYSE